MFMCMSKGIYLHMGMQSHLSHEQAASTATHVHVLLDAYETLP